MTTWNTPNMEKAKTKTERANFRSSTSSSNMREKAWNNRFILGKIQDYNIYDNQYCNNKPFIIVIIIIYQ